MDYFLAKIIICKVVESKLIVLHD